MNSLARAGALALRRLLHQCVLSPAGRRAGQARELPTVTMVLRLHELLQLRDRLVHRDPAQPGAVLLRDVLGFGCAAARPPRPVSDLGIAPRKGSARPNRAEACLHRAMPGTPPQGKLDCSSTQRIQPESSIPRIDPRGPMRTGFNWSASPSGARRAFHGDAQFGGGVSRRARVCGRAGMYMVPVTCARVPSVMARLSQKTDLRF